MVSYEYIFKLIDAKLTRRKTASVQSTENKSSVKNSEKNGKKSSPKSAGDKNGSCVSKDSKSTSTKSWLSVIVHFLNIFAIAILLAVLFYVVPWENWVFSEEELERLEQEGIEMQDFLATADQTFDEVR